MGLRGEVAEASSRGHVILMIHVDVYTCIKYVVCDALHRLFDVYSQGWLMQISSEILGRRSAAHALGILGQGRPA